MAKTSQEKTAIDDGVWGLESVGPDGILELARKEPTRFLWAAAPEDVLDHGGQELQELLKPSLAEAELSVALRWLRQPGFLGDDEAVAILESQLERAESGAGWFALAEALSAMRRRGAIWKTARHLSRLLDRFWLDASEADAVERVAAEFMDSALLATLMRHAPWRGDSKRLEHLVDLCTTQDIVRSLDTGFGLDRETTDRLHGLLWRALAKREDPAALESCTRLLAERLDDALGRATGLDVTLTLQRVHGEQVTPWLVAVFLSGAHRSPTGELIERWMLARPESALSSALDPLPEWMPRFEVSAMERLSWRLLPRLDGEARNRVRDLAEFTEGARGQTVLDELQSLGDAQ